MLVPDSSNDEQGTSFARGFCMTTHCERNNNTAVSLLDYRTHRGASIGAGHFYALPRGVWMEAAIQFLIIERCHWRTSVHEISVSSRKINYDRCRRILALGNVSATPVPPDGCRLTVISPARTALTRDTRRRPRPKLSLCGPYPLSATQSSTSCPLFVFLRETKTLPAPSS